VEASKDQIRLGDVPLGGRLMVRSRLDWRNAAVVRSSEELVVISVASPGGRTYRLRRGAETILVVEGSIPFLKSEQPDLWRENFSRYDTRW
jgi:chorismate-pyruvate lyase